MITPDLVVAVSPHPDDSEWGAGGTLSRFSNEGSEVRIVTLTVTTADRDREGTYAARILGAEYHALHLGHDGTLRTAPSSVDSLADALTGAGLVLCPPATDSHQDHRSAHALVRSAVRRSPTSVWEYETPSTYDWTPNTWADLGPDDLLRKRAAILAHGSQLDRPYMDPDLVVARSAVAGANAGRPFSEPFRIVRAII